jgi:hypothetical protein
MFNIAQTKRTEAATVSVSSRRSTSDEARGNHLAAYGGRNHASDVRLPTLIYSAHVGFCLGSLSELERVPRSRRLRHLHPLR